MRRGLQPKVPDRLEHPRHSAVPATAEDAQVAAEVSVLHHRVARSCRYALGNVSSAWVLGLDACLQVGVDGTQDLVGAVLGDVKHLAVGDGLGESQRDDWTCLASGF